MDGWIQPRERAFFHLKGPDAVRFLNGQVSNDVSVDLTTKVIPACLCSLKGKVSALVWITSLADGLLIEAEESQAEAVFGRLDRYLIADDCELSELDEAPVFHHVISGESPQANARECWRYGIQGFDVPGAPASGEELDHDQLFFTSIEHGIPYADYEITGEEFPSDLGLDRWAVDFHKGCYLGQEVVSRIESVGKSKNSLKLFATDIAFNMGHRFSNQSGKEIGRVVRDSLPFPDRPGRYLTSLYGRTERLPELGFEPVEVVRPKKLS